MKRLLPFLLIFCMLASCAYANRADIPRVTFAPDQPPRKADNTSFTLFWYVNGSDLESGNEDDYGGAFTDNLDEVLTALPPDDRFRVIIFTGGTRDWKTKGISVEQNQVHMVTREGLSHGPALGEGSIAEAETLTSFLQYGLATCPADRYGLIFWDHGSGVPIGFGYDELREPRYMDLTALTKGLENGLNGERLSFIGFDTCLMATVETAAACSPYADYLIASEELEPFGGWDYKPVMQALGNDPGIDTETFGETVINGFFGARKNASETLTLSVTDLSKVSPVVDAVSDLAVGIKALLDEGGFSRISRVRSRVKYYGGANQSVDMIDLVHLAERLRSDYPEEAERLTEAVRDCVILNKHTAGAPNSNGLSIYFPYENEGVFKNHLDLYMQCGFSEHYLSFVRDFTEKLKLGDASLYMVGVKPKKNGTVYTVSIPPEWHILEAHGVLARKQGYGVYLLIGLSGGVTYDEAADHVSGTPPDGWLTVNGNPAFAQRESGEDGIVQYSVMAELDGRRVSLVASCDDDKFNFLGAVPEAQDGRVPMPSYLPLDEGDTVTLLYPKLDTRSTEHDEVYEKGPSFTIESPMEFGFAQVEGKYGFLLTDCYHNEYVTDMR